MIRKINKSVPFLMENTMEELLGFYHVIIIRTRFYSHQFQLEIFRNTENQIEFALKLIVSGGFGSSGSTWEGNCILDKDQLIFNAKMKIDWSDTNVEDQRNESISDKSVTFQADILHEDKGIEIKMYMENNVYYLSKIISDRKDIDSLIYWTVASIKTKHELKQSIIVWEKIPDWRIATLLIKEINPITYEGIKATEIIVEYDLYTEKEQQTPNEGEFIKEHYKSVVIFDNSYKVLEFNISN